jgi:hypothetical protein
MEDVRNNSGIFDSPIYEFVESVWIDWVSAVPKVKADDEDLLLYLIWALDSVKEQGKEIDEKFWLHTYSAIHRNLSGRDGELNETAIEFLTNLTCACVLCCLGLNLAGESDNQEVFMNFVAVLGDHWPDVKKIKRKIMGLQVSEGLMKWVSEYRDSNRFYTLRKLVDWDDREFESLPDLRRSASSVPAVTLTQVNIGTLHNHPGAEFNDNSVMIELQKK